MEQPIPHLPKQNPLYWEKIDWTDVEDIQRDQPELYPRHYDNHPQRKIQ